MRFVLVFLLIAVAFFATGEALKCYQCALTAACSDTFDKSGTGVTEFNCANDRNVCVKSTAELKNGTTLTVRQCGFSIGRADGSTFASGLTIVSAKEYYCDEDLCNGVSMNSVTVSTLIVLVVSFIFGRYH